MEIYKGQLKISNNDNKIISCYVGSKIFGNKPYVKWVTCDSKTCKEQSNCSMQNFKFSGLNICPHAHTSILEQPRRNCKPYYAFLETCKKIPTAYRLGQYSQFVWDNKDVECDKETYNKLKELPEFDIKNLSDVGISRKDLFKELEERRDYDKNRYRGLFDTRIGVKFISSFCRLAHDEFAEYGEMVSARVFMSEEVIAQREFEKKTGELFKICDDYIIILIPYLEEFEPNGVKQYMHYREGIGYNAVKIDDFHNVITYLKTYVPSKSYRFDNKYLPYIKKEIQLLLEKIEELRKGN